LTKQDIKLLQRLQPSPNNAILSTLALAWAEHTRPLLAAEVLAYLHASEQKRPTLAEIKYGLSLLAQERIIQNEHGHYWLDAPSASHKELYERMHASAQKMKQARGALFLLEAVPFVKTAAVTGSTAFGSAKEHSDIDLFCIAKKERIWTARMGMLILSEFLGRRRTRSRSAKKGKLCFNYFAAENAILPVQNVASANMLAWGIPVFGKKEYRSFLAMQTWMRTFLSQPLDETQITKSAHLPEPSPALVFVKTTAEKILGNNAVGNAVEKICKAWQRSRLRHKISGAEDTSYFFMNDGIIALHYPNPKNKAVMERYVNKMNEIKNKERRS